MKIIRLTAENVKRLSAVEIEPDGNVVVIGGRNGQGKSSVLDAIWLALAGGTAAKATTRPVRDGEDHAQVTLDLGDIVVTRTWNDGKTTLRVASQDGARYTSPQSVLDGLIGALSFDPLEFTRLSARAQVAALLDLVDLDVNLDALADERAALYEERTDVGRQAKALGDVPALLPGVPEQEESAAAILGQIREAQDLARSKDAARRAFETEQERINAWEREVADLQAKIAEATPRAKALHKAWKSTPDAPDTQELEERLAAVEQTNRDVRHNAHALAVQAQKAGLDAQYEALTQQIQAIDTAKAEALAAAQFPVDGLGFDDTGVTYQGVPFSQASSAEQIRVSLAMAMAANPQLRVIRILDGSLLDEDSLRLISEQAVEQDFQVWIERVGDADENAVIIEDGQVSW